jgi:hypothetical protein
LRIQENSRLDISREEGLGTTIGLVKKGSHSRITKNWQKNLKKKKKTVTRASVQPETQTNLSFTDGIFYYIERCVVCDVFH